MAINLGLSNIWIEVFTAPTASAQNLGFPTYVFIWNIVYVEKEMVDTASHCKISELRKMESSFVATFCLQIATLPMV